MAGPAPTVNAINPGSQQPSETLREFLIRRERELTHRLSALQAELGPVEAELAQIRRARTAVDTAPTLSGLNSNAAPPTGFDYVGPLLELLDTKSPSEMTIKQLVIRAFTAQFRKGATPAQLREFIRDAYGRDIERGSLSPQLSRMKAEGLIEQDAATDVWKLALRGVTADELIAIGHWPPGAKMKPQDALDNPNLLALAERLAWKAEDDAPSEGDPPEGAPKSLTESKPVKRRL
jgi:hypothetical protein